MFMALQFLITKDEWVVCAKGKETLLRKQVRLIINSVIIYILLRFCFIGILQLDVQAIRVLQMTVCDVVSIDRSNTSDSSS